MTGNLDMVRVHVDDQMDSKSLLGAYVCTSNPEEFVWQPGPLTQVSLCNSNPRVGSTVSVKGRHFAAPLVHHCCYHFQLGLKPEQLFLHKATCWKVEHTFEAKACQSVALCLLKLVYRQDWCAMVCRQ